MITNRINANPPSEAIPSTTDGAGRVIRAPSKDTLAPAAPSGSQIGASDTVTITDGARASAQILDQARAADGIDHAAVSKLRSAIQSQTYHVPAEQLATAIVAAIAEQKA